MVASDLRAAGFEDVEQIGHGGFIIEDTHLRILHGYHDACGEGWRARTDPAARRRR
ncbi:hypothetical protein ACFV4K_20105 [Nocardia sp. NPDC059764]|uniref:hypothetical protein n=1 Tax=Nocardia sp. NPDC059764 TaxID=3346939 RepID=UPI003652933A